MVGAPALWGPAVSRPYRRVAGWGGGWGGHDKPRGQQGLHVQLLQLRLVLQQQGPHLRAGEEDGAEAVSQGGELPCCGLLQNAELPDRHRGQPAS